MLSFCGTLYGQLVTKMLAKTCWKGLSFMSSCFDSPSACQRIDRIITLLNVLAKTCIQCHICKVPKIVK